MQRGDEHGALDRKLERALLQQMGQDVGDVEPLPNPAEQHRAADPLRRNRQRAFGVLVESVDEQHLVGELGRRSDERGERARGAQFVGTAEIGDHPLADGGAVARVLDDLHVAALAGSLEAEEHGPSLSSTTESDSSPNIKRKNCANVALHFEKPAHRPQSYQCLASARVSLLFKSGLTQISRTNWTPSIDALGFPAPWGNSASAATASPLSWSGRLLTT